MFELIGTALGSTVVAVVVTELFHWFHPGRIGVKIGALRDEIAVLREIDDGTGLGKAAYAVGSATVETAMINRLVPSRTIQSLGLVFVSLVSFALVLTFSASAEPQDMADQTLLVCAIILYSLFGIFLLACGIFGWLASVFVRTSISMGFRLSAEVERDNLDKAFADLKTTMFKAVNDGETQQYRFRRWYQLCLTQTSRTHIRVFIREIDEHVPSRKPAVGWT